MLVAAASLACYKGHRLPTFHGGSGRQRRTGDADSGNCRSKRDARSSESEQERQTRTAGLSRVTRWTLQLDGYFLAGA